MSERWHRLPWLPEANRKQIVLFTSSYSLQERAVDSKGCHCLIAQIVALLCFISWWVKKSLHINILLTVYSSSWSLLRNNQITCQLSILPQVHALFVLICSLVLMILTLPKECENKRNSVSEMCITESVLPIGCHVALPHMNTEWWTPSSSYIRPHYEKWCSFNEVFIKWHISIFGNGRLCGFLRKVTTCWHLMQETVTNIFHLHL